MKTSALRKFRNKLAADEPVYGLWVTLESPTISEMASALGLDWLVVDAEHGQLDWKEILEHIRATSRSDTVALVRLPELNGGMIKRALDLGADGVVIPWIEEEEQIRQAVAFARYPPEGKRGIGGERATGWGESLAEHTAEANPEVLVVPIIETALAERNIERLATAEVPVFFFGPADFSASCGYRGQWEGPGVAARLLALKDALRARGKHSGVLTTDLDQLIRRRFEGFRMIGLGTDTGFFLRGLHGALAVVGRDRRIRTSMLPEGAPLPAIRLDRPPSSLQPDRPEVMAQPGASQPIELAPGVRLDCLVGRHNSAHSLTTGLTTIAPGAALPYHTHTVGESITVISGAGIVGVEGREYELGFFDNVTVPRETPHSFWNRSDSVPCVVHVALASDAPSRNLVHTPFPRRKMEGAAGPPDKEHVTRIGQTAGYEAGAGTKFVDYFNRELMPGVEMSGGYGLFQPGGRLPAHCHDFDESICIVEGSATCVVEGRRYSMSGGATALQPRGRVHYFVNESTAPMAMIWVYAHPVPERVTVDERWTLPGADPWQIIPA